MATMTVLDSTGSTETVEKPNSNGRAAAAASRPVVLAMEDLAAINGITSAIGAATFYPATQPVSGTVGVSGSVAVTGTFWQATQPISAASLPLPSGAATSANQSTANGLLTSIDSALAGTLVVDGSGATQPVSAASLPLPTGAATSAKQDDTIAAINALAGSEYETVAASQTNQALGATGGSGDLLVSLLVVPASTSPGAVQIKDGAGSAITVFAGGADSVSTLHPFAIPLGIRSSSGAWQVTTGTNVSVIAAGNFT